MSAELLPATRRALLHRLATGQADGRAPSVVATVVRDGVPVWTEARGEVGGSTPDGNTQYRIGSISKTFVTVLVLRLRDEGRLALTDRLDQHLPGTAAGDATVGSLLAHTAGLAAEPPGPWWERTPGSLRPELDDLVQEPPRVHPQGERFHYSNSGFALLGALVEKLRGAAWGDVLQREILDPLGMNRTSLLPVAPHADGWAVHPWADVLLPEPAHDTARMGPAGQLWSTVSDLARFAAFLLDGDERVLSTASREQMRTPAAPPEASSWDSGYGLGTQLLRRDGRLLSGHTGSMPGFVATVWISPADRVGAVVLANVTAGFPVPAVAADLVRIVAEQEPGLPPVWRPLATVDAALLELTGPWYWGAAPFVLRLKADGMLELGSLSGGRGTRLRRDGDSWIGLSDYYAGERLTVRRDDTGAVTHLDLGTFVFTRQPYEPGAVIPGGADPAGWRPAVS